MKFLGHNFPRVLLLACVTLIFACSSASADYEQGFDSLSTSGWSTVDASDSPGGDSWTQPTDANRPYLAHSGAPNSFVRNSVDDRAYETVTSNWLISPRFSTLSNGDVISFQMRTTQMYSRFWVGPYDMHLELRAAFDSDCSLPVTGAAVGDFDARLLHVIPAQFPNAHQYDNPWSARINNPEWAEQSVAISGLAAGDHEGCLAIRVWSGLSISGSGVVGIDDFKLREDQPTVGEITLLPPTPKSGRVQATWLRGRADAGSTVELFKNARCTSPAALSLSAELFHWPGAVVGADANTTTEYSARSIDAAGVASPCKGLGTYLNERVPPETTDDVGPGRSYPGPVKLVATDSGSGVARTYYRVVEVGKPFDWPVDVYDPAKPPILDVGLQIVYFSIDNFGNQESMQYSVQAPAPSNGRDDPSGPRETDPPEPSGPTGSVAAKRSPPRVRPSSDSLRVKNGRIWISLSCFGRRDSVPCSGQLSLAVQARTKRGTKVLSTDAVDIWLLPESTGSVSVPLTGAIRTYLKSLHGRTPWASVLIKQTDASAQPTFRRKLKR